MRQCRDGSVAAIVISGAGKSAVGREWPGPDENPIAVDIDRPLSEIVKSAFGVLYVAARKPR